MPTFLRRIITAYRLGLKVMVTAEDSVKPLGLDRTKGALVVSVNYAVDRGDLTVTDVYLGQPA